MYIRRIQRFTSPRNTLEGPFNPPSGFGFKAREMLNKAIHIDYMGNADFEFGELQRAFKATTEKARKLRADVIEVTPLPACREIKNAQSRLERAQNDADGSDYFQQELARAQQVADYTANPQAAPIYIIAAGNDLPDVKIFIQEDAQDLQYLAEPTQLRDSFVNSYHADKIGWFDLDNHFFFFKDWVMFDRVAKIFDVKHNIPQPVVPPARATPAAQPSTLTA